MWLEKEVQMKLRNTTIILGIGTFAAASLSFLKINLIKQLSVFARGHKKQVAVKGLGYRAEFFVSKNRQFLNFKISYSQFLNFYTHHVFPCT